MSVSGYMISLFSILTLIFLSSLSGAQPASGPLTVHPENPRYFADADGDAVFLTGSHTWMNLQDFRKTGYPDFSWEDYLDFLEANNHNFVRLWVIEYEYDKENDVWGLPSVFQRTGPGTAYDGRLRYDLTKYNQAYMDRLKSRVSSAQSRGIYVSIMLFSSFCADYSDTYWVEGWKSHPFHQGNNINGIDADCDGDGLGSELHTMCDADVLQVQEDYVRAVVDSVNEYDNVLFEIGNELAYESKDFQYHMIDLIHQHESTKPKQHPVGMTSGGPRVDGGWSNFPKSYFMESNAEWVSPSGVWGDVTNDPPATDGSKVVILDTDHISRPEHRDWVWKCLTRGYNPILMDVLQLPYPYAIGESWNDPENPIQRRVEQRPAMGHALSYAQRINLGSMTPHDGLASSGYCLANPGNEYLVFKPGGGSFTVELQDGIYSYEWFNAVTGTADSSGTTEASGVTSFTPGFSGDAVLYLQAVNPRVPGLLGHWKFDEGSGSIVGDSSGNSLAGTVNGASWVTGKLDGALNFDGNDDYVEIADSPYLDITGNMTITAWVQRDSSQAGWRIVAARESGTGSQEHFLLGFHDNNYVFLVNTDSGYKIVEGGNAPLEEWIHVAGTYDGTYVRLFAGGAEIGSDTHSGGFSPDSNPLILGAGTNNHGDSFTEFLSGSIDDVRLYDMVLTESKIAQLASGQPVNQPPVADAGPDIQVTFPGPASLQGSASDDGLPSGSLTYSWSKVSGSGTVTFGDSTSLSTSAAFSEDGGYVLRLTVSDGDLSASDDLSVTVYPEPSAEGLIGHWNFDEVSGASVYDISGNGIDGTVSGAAWVTGRIGMALEFDGTNDYVRVDDSPLLDITDEVTVSAWVLKKADKSGWQAIVSREFGTGNPEHYFLSFYDNNVRWFVDTTSGYSSVITGPPAGNDIWYQLAGIYDGSHVRLYVNGQESFSLSHSGTFAPDDNPVFIGAATSNHEASIEEHFPGLIDDVRIYSRALSPQEILDLYDSAFHEADNNPRDGCVKEDEMMGFIGLWKLDSAAHPMFRVMDAVGLWKSGVGCI